MALITILSLALLLSQAQDSKIQIGEIEFYGSAGINLDRVRAALPVHEGDILTQSASEKTNKQIRKTLQDLIGHAPTDVSFVCCDDKQRLMIYLGLGGRSSEDIRYDPAPAGPARLPSSLVKLSGQIDNAIAKAVARGAGAEDDSQGYALLADPVTNALQLKLRDVALQNEPLLREVLLSSGNVNHRQIAAETLGYADRSPAQISALVKASGDPDSGVRNNAIRALGVLATVGAEIPATGFVEMLGSGIWTDRNKAVLLLMKMTEKPNPDVLAELRADAVEPLIEMAKWRSTGHAYAARILLGRAAGIDEKKLQELADKGQVDSIIEAIRRHP
jgi:hypothetical protein